MPSTPSAFATLMFGIGLLARQSFFLSQELCSGWWCGPRARASSSIATGLRS